MNQDTIIDILSRNRDAITKMGVRHAALFGSHSRGNAHPDSDIDLLIDLDPDKASGVFEYAAVIDGLQSLFSQPVDVCNRAALKARMKARIEGEMIRVF